MLLCPPTFAEFEPRPTSHRSSNSTAEIAEKLNISSCYFNDFCNEYMQFERVRGRPTTQCYVV